LNRKQIARWFLKHHSAGRGPRTPDQRPVAISQPALLVLALNTSGALGHRMIGTALVDAVGPAPLIGWSEVEPWMLRQIYAVCSPTAPAQPEPRAATGLTPDTPWRPTRSRTGTRRRAPYGNRQTHLAGHPSRSDADRARSGGRHRRRRPCRDGRRGQGRPTASGVDVCPTFASRGRGRARTRRPQPGPWRRRIAARDRNSMPRQSRRRWHRRACAHGTRRASRSPGTVRCQYAS
jgi:hypothetical protein